MASSTAPPPGEHELKFHLPKHRTPGFRHWLNQTFVQHPEHSRSMICSIYFDTPDGRSLEEKVQSDFAKTKYRVRWYADDAGVPLPVPAFIEIKEKHGAIRRKHRTALPVPPSDLIRTPLGDDFFATLFQRHVTTGRPLPLLRPVLELRYLRQRYLHRCFAESFCLDSDIRCTRTRAGSHPPAHSMPLPFDVFEQKGASSQPVPALQVLPRFDARRSAISKYYETQRHLWPDHDRP